MSLSDETDRLDRHVSVFVNNAEINGLSLGEPTLFFEPSMRLFEEPTIFLRERFVESGRRRSPKTWANVAYALAGWFEYLAAIGLPNWRLASRGELIAYRDAYFSAISPVTGRAYAAGTIANRMMAVLAFYSFARDRGWYEGPNLHTKTAKEPAPVPLDRDALAHTRRRRRSRSDSDLLPTRRSGCRSIRAFSPIELRAFLHELGPRASERNGNDLRPSRDRLIGDLGVFVGLRNDEIHQLTKYPFLAMHPDAYAPTADQRLTVVGKGRIVRTVAIANWLAEDVIAYVQGERAEAVRTGGLTGRKEPPDLFVAGSNSTAPGRPLTHRRFQQIVEEACVRAGLVDFVRRTDPETGEVGEVTKSRHCVHDLRHTYAVLTYWAERQGGNSEPWKKIQAQLGHAHLTTTVDIYLRHVEIFGERERLDIRRLIGL